MPIASPSPSSKILVVEDSAFEQRMLVDLLSELPYSVTVAFNGMQGYQLALAQQPDLILLDVHMPGMDGYAACRLLKANAATQDIPIIFLSGNNNAEDRILGLSLGGVDFIGKPYSSGELAARIQVHLGLAMRVRTRTPRDAAAPDPTLVAVTDPEMVLVNAVKRLISNNLAAPPSLTEIASKVGTYREKLSQLFRAHTGMTVFAYIRAARIECGMNLLRETDIEVQDIALLVGFNNAGNFATAFRESSGLTPSAYRQAQQQLLAAAPGSPAETGKPG